jgi:hypothetical protein
MSEQMAVMKGVDIGLRDTAYPVLWFTVYLNDSLCALQVLSWHDAGKLIEDSDVHSVSDLEGRACYVETGSGCGGAVKFLRAAKI